MSNKAESKNPESKKQASEKVVPENHDLDSKGSSNEGSPPRDSKRERKPPSHKLTPAAWTAISAIVVALLAYVFGPMVNTLLQRTPVTTATSIATLTQTPTLTATNTLTPTSTFTPSPTATPLPIPCANGFFACVFPQAAGGKIFDYSSDPTASLTVDALSNECAFTSEHGVKLTYNIPEENNNVSWGVEWKSTDGLYDAASFTIFTFAVKGDIGDEIFLIGMKDIAGSPVTLESTNYVTVSSTKWEKVTIPFDDFIYKGATINPSRLENVSFSFDERHGSGSICIDDIAFAK